MKQIISGSSVGTRRLLSTYDINDYAYRSERYSSLYVFYYDKQGNDVLTDLHMNKSHLIEQAIKSYNGYNNHTFIVL